MLEDSSKDCKHQSRHRHSLRYRLKLDDHQVFFWYKMTDQAPYESSQRTYVIALSNPQTLIQPDRYGNVIGKFGQWEDQSYIYDIAQRKIILTEQGSKIQTLYGKASMKTIKNNHPYIFEQAIPYLDQLSLSKEQGFSYECNIPTKLKYIYVVYATIPSYYYLKDIYIQDVQIPIGIIFSEKKCKLSKANYQSID